MTLSFRCPPHFAESKNIHHVFCFLHNFNILFRISAKSPGKKKKEGKCIIQKEGDPSGRGKNAIFSYSCPISSITAFDCEVLLFLFSMVEPILHPAKRKWGIQNFNKMETFLGFNLPLLCFASLVIFLHSTIFPNHPTTSPLSPLYLYFWPPLILFRSHSKAYLVHSLEC